MESNSTPNRSRKRARIVYFSEEELNQIAQRMRSQGLKNFSKFARQTLTSGVIVTSTKSAGAERISREIAAIGNNINQIARKANTENIATYEQVLAAIDLLDEVRKLVQSELGSARGRGENPSDKSNTA
ncbi:Bacterial mobilisation protein (MobC) [Arcanobacterium haemolyticum]|uniref:Mobilisation protein n=1 Tax=Arcanobacterium haemolyticum (strain ATCC 9345 / DSM 20595 / CCM 5947 / CCUG 17215 / LMG 16163 / NBRC 15585 / NCTC 8452 / 11018) TaxID=644284 RepID=D7BL37_ARCHD|nr:mobilisation protein [Arcanobacterium haemolyticum DSM 20595]SQH27752.1 Bacterial mobilisation protein (MobC) [Arcanobacterium haemolyticum]